MSAKPLVLDDILAPERNNFGALRLAMALAVLVSHSVWLATGQVVLEPLKGVTGFTLGEHAVQVFFFLSGVVVAQSIMKSGSLLDFTVARVLRIFPALIVCVMLTALVIGPLASDLGLRQYVADQGVMAYILRTVSLSTGSAPLPGVFTDNPVPNLVNLSLWTLKYEVACYVLLGLFGWGYLKAPRLRPLLTMGLALVVIGAFAGSLRPVEPLSGLGSLRYFVVFFFAGSLAYLARERLVISWLALPPLLVLFALAIKTPFAELTAALFLGYATLCAAALPLGAIRRFTNAQDYSYGVYILHCPIQQLIIDRKVGIGPVELTLVALTIVIPLSILFWNLIEHPAMRQRRGIVAALRALPLTPAGWRRPANAPDTGAAVARAAVADDPVATPAMIGDAATYVPVATRYRQPISGGFRR